MTQQGDLPTYHELRQRLEAVQAELERAEQAARESELRRVALDGERDQLERRLSALEGDRAAAQRELEREREAAGQALEDQRQQLAEAERDARLARQLAAQRKRDLDQALGIAIVALRDVRDDVRRVEQSAAWRYGHKASLTAARVRMRAPKTAGAVAAARERIDQVIATLSSSRGELPPRAGGDAQPAPDQRPSPASRRALAQAIRDRLGAIPERDGWPGVSIVVVNRDGAQLLTGLLDGLRETDYPALELLVCDLDSTDGSVELIESAQLPFEVGMGRHGADATFAAVCNQAAERAQHPLLLFLDNGIEPFEVGWCKELVDALLAAGAGAAGATLVQTSTIGSGDEAVQQRGLGLERSAGLAQPAPLEQNTGLFGPMFGSDLQCVAVSGACLLVERASFHRVGGFEDGHRLGFTDVDLALRLAATGEQIVSSGRAVLAYEPPPTDEDSERLIRRRLSERWGPALWRELRLALGRRDPRWAGDRVLHIAIARTSADARASGSDHHLALGLGEALVGLGWRVSYLDPREESRYRLDDEIDAVVALTPDFDPARVASSTTTVAWMGASPAAWCNAPHFDRYDILLAASPQIAASVRAATGREPDLFPPATNPNRFSPDAHNEALETDYLLAEHRDAPLALEPALAPRNGERVALYGHGWNRVRPLRNVARGPVAYERLPGIYASCRVVIDDGDRAAGGEQSLGAGVLDAIASGAAVVTNCANGARELFDDEFPIWSDAASLRAQLDALLSAPDRRDELVRRYRRTVLERHTFGHRAGRLRELVEAQDERRSFCLKIEPPDWQQAMRWGDLYLARDLSRALKRRGHRCLVQVRREWDEPAALAYDVAVHLKGWSAYAPRPGQFNVLWLISHPTELSVDEANAYDLVCVASRSFADELRARVAVPVAVLEQATDPWRFYPDPDPSLAHDLAFVGNARGSRRHLLDELLPTAHDLAVWGNGLAGMVDARHLQGEWFANEQLRRVYSSAKVVLCDHWEDMRTHGFASNRLYDAVASGAVVVTDAVAGVDGQFGDAVVPCSDADELRETVDRLLSSDEERAQRTVHARERLLRADTFDHRAATLASLVAEHAPATGHRQRLAA